ncbi:hypothetical protein QCA50_002376 [Cerrena zonata]|uniref:Uncharacterized protein n=1 Tax=Cerrena zonata TaxID=2478898 RepID=A0AAW0GRC3_9APHY
MLDPRIIEDVQRAIKLKARREARIRALQSVTSKDTSSLSDAPSGSSVSVRSSPLRSTFGPISAPLQLPLRQTV